MNTGTVVYKVDSNDTIISLNAQWDDFARQNGWAVQRDDVMGRSLWDFMSGIEVTMLWRELFAVIRARHSTVNVPFRCDSPSIQRNMSLELVPLPARAIECRATTLLAQPHSSLLQGVQSSPPPDDADEFIRICSWCKKLVVAGAWIELAVGINQLKLFESQTTPKLTHGVCPSCRDEMLSPAGPLMDRVASPCLVAES